MSHQRTRRPLIVPIFIPFQGCPHRCIYCEQVKITTQPSLSVDAYAVKKTLDQALCSPRFDPLRNPEVAFYGGTFTGLPQDRMISLLEAVEPYLREGAFKAIRVSTRPDSINEERLAILKQYHVSTVELGAQSMNDEVLKLSRRGHSAHDTMQSAFLLKEMGFKLGIQLMLGLPGDSQESLMGTVAEIVTLRPAMVRLYPTLVIRGTELGKWYLENRYRPLGLEEAVSLCRDCCIQFEGEGIPVIRIGLMSSPSLIEEGQILAGPWHEAFGSLVRSEIFHKKIEPSLPAKGTANAITVRVSSRDLPLLKGFRNFGIQHIETITGARVVAVISDVNLLPGSVEVDQQ